MRRQAVQRRNAQREHLFVSDAGRSDLDYFPHEGHLLGGPVPSHCAKTREEAIAAVSHTLFVIIPMSCERRNFTPILERITLTSLIPLA